MNLAIVGCRYYTDYEFFTKAVDKWIEENGRPDMIVSGGATGADFLAERYAKEKGYKMQVFPANWGMYGKQAGRIRNQQIVDMSTHMIAFPSKESKGTRISISLMKEKGISPTVIEI